ncbi:hypothetical protein MMC07_009436 [Pseudocyphellaria aurata]|nr:hypothetical protein [Pseudocyphellaria aurata]
MSTFTFASLPPEILVIIAGLCKGNDLLNLCKTSKLVNETCSHLIFRSVDLRLDRLLLGHHDFRQIFNVQRNSQQQFLHALLRHPANGMHVRVLKAKIAPHLDPCYSKGDDNIPEVEFWRALQSLTRVQCVDWDYFVNPNTQPTTPIPNALFQSATSVRLVGQVHYGLVKSILNSLNPATLKHLCLIMVEDFTHLNDRVSTSGDGSEDEQKSALFASSGLLTNLKGRCTALRNLVLRRVGQSPRSQRKVCPAWRSAAEEASYFEWASFIHSVQETVEKFTFEQSGFNSIMDYTLGIRSSRAIDERFRRIVLPAIVTGTWPCLKIMELRGVRDADGVGGPNTLETTLRAVLGEDVRLSVEDDNDHGHDSHERYQWNGGET